MTRFEEIARVTARGHGLDTVGDGSEKSNSFLVHQAILTDINSTRGKPEVFWRADPSGARVEGYIWYGAMASVVEALWPVESKVKDPVTKQGMGVLINKYLRHTNNAVCIDRHGKDRTPKWWIRSTWNDAPPPSSSALPGVVPTYAERRLTADEAGETRSPAPIEVRHAEPKLTPSAPTPAPAPAETEEDRAVAMIKGAASVHATQPTRADLQVQRVKERVDASPAVTLVRGRTSYAVTPNGQPAPPAYPFSCGMTDVSGRVCHRVFANQGHKTFHQNSGHPLIDLIIEAVAKLIKGQRRVNGENLGELIGHHPTTIYSYFEDLADVEAAGHRLIARRTQERRDARATLAASATAAIPIVPDAVEPRGQGRRPTPAVAVEKAREHDEVRAREISQLIVGFCQAVGINVNSSALRQFPMPVAYANRGAFFDQLVTDGTLTLIPTKTANNASVSIYVPGPRFDEKIARRLSVLLPENGVTVEPAPVATPVEMDVVSLLELAIQQVKAINDTTSIAKLQDEELTKLARDRAEALELAQLAVDETVEVRAMLTREQENATRLEKKLDHFRRVLND